MVITIVFKDRPIPVKYYGGTERIVYWLMKELVKNNQTVYLLGDKYSKVSDIGVELIPLDNNTDWRLKIPKNTDIVHTMNMDDIDCPFPLINTVHVNEYKKYPLNSVFVSKSHAENHNAKVFVYNGLDLEEYPFIRKRNYKNEKYLFLANARWDVKNLHDCIRVSVELGKKLYICGGDFRSGLKYFKKEGCKIFYPFLPNIKYFGQVDQNKKLQIMKQIDAFLWPVRWEEPFGIAIIEAMSQGIPVFASPYGSSKEIIPNFAGKICNNYNYFKLELSESNNNWNIYEIRNYVENHFTSKIMTKNYLILYEKILSKEYLHKINPQLKINMELLPF